MSAEEIMVCQSLSHLGRTRRTDASVPAHGLLQDRGPMEILKWVRYRQKNNSPPRGWLQGNHHPTPADYAAVFPVNEVDWAALAAPPGAE
jgi:hypothetical protein